ncbi:signal peptidase I [Aeromicrobium sp. Root495]|uniref:signal peptidase I n=1 Tax=Aeromicrobium sp. Root495 TaxID=1736550 RepID=UPI00138F85C0|nr:signal peptidase I [Aeromicrobium sp. Root495]
MAVWALLLGFVAMLVVAVLVPRLAGATPYTVLTGSMQPTMPPGTLVVAKPVDPEALEVGDVVTVQLRSGQDVYVTHRVSAVKHRLDGTTLFETKGDANDTPDGDLRLPEQIRGERWYSVQYLGYVNNVLNGQQRQTAVYVVAGGLIAYAVLMIGSGVRDRTRKTPEPGRRKKEAVAS